MEKAAGHHALQDARIARHRPKEIERRRAAHELVEFRLHLRRIRGIDRTDSRRHSAIVTPEPPISLGMSFIFGKPSLIRSFVSW